ncbi:MAG TPA: LuxR C-terminal-related transcriptional regulator [Myxococcales bacterium]|nr:LuxR C-terminal-related transcriptional regulator [Myxococcales bacterium]
MSEPQLGISGYRPAARENAGIRNLTARLSTISEHEEPATRWLVPALRERLDTEIALAYRIEDAPGGPELRDYCASGMPFTPAEVALDMQRLVRTGRWGLFDPLRPEAPQRNLVVDLGRYRALLAEPTPPRGLGIGRAEIDRARANLDRVLDELPVLKFCFVEECEMRVLVCDGAALLAWVGVLQADPFSPRQRWALESIVPALRRRLALEQVMERAPVATAALGAALDAIPAAALILTEQGKILHANAAGRRWASEKPNDLKAAISESLRAGHPDARLSLTRVEAPDRRPLFLAIAQSTDALVLRTRTAAARWHLTARQAQVLSLLAQGKANKSIAAELSCALHTVEIHVAALLEKAQCDSRSALIAHLWC